MNIDSFFLTKKVIKDINNWINKDYKKQFLFIHGKDGNGKTSLAESMMRDGILSTKWIYKNIYGFSDDEI